MNTGNTLPQARNTKPAGTDTNARGLRDKPTQDTTHATNATETAGLTSSFCVRGGTVPSEPCDKFSFCYLVVGVLSFVFVGFVPGFVKRVECRFWREGRGGIEPGPNGGGGA